MVIFLVNNTLICSEQYSRAAYGINKGKFLNVCTISYESSTVLLVVCSAMDLGMALLVPVQTAMAFMVHMYPNDFGEA